MDEVFYGRCDHCDTIVRRRHHALNRHIERCVYPVPGIPGRSVTQVDVLHAEELARYCGPDCAEVGAYCQMQDRGIGLNDIGPGPILPCSKCGKPMDLRQPHVAYEMMDQTETRQPWLFSVQPHDSRTIAHVCRNCDGNLQSVSEKEIHTNTDKMDSMARTL